VAQVVAKDESRRNLGSFKSLGGMVAGLRALCRAAGVPSFDELLSPSRAPRSLSLLLAASDGNHGLAVAAAAELAGTGARIYLHRHVPAARARRIAERGAEIVWVDGTYDDAVDAAAGAAARGDGLLISDTSADENDPVVADVMAGYALLAQEILDQWPTPDLPPTHLFVQAGVGGLAAAVADRLRTKWQIEIVIVEPVAAACVGVALRTGRIERIAGDLRTAAEMLSCGEASAPAIKILRRLAAKSLAVEEPTLAEALKALSECAAPATTPSGATGIAGLLSTPPTSRAAAELNLTASGRVLAIITEAPVPAD
jgi:diaminopropionate ammonia-lyase